MSLNNIYLLTKIITGVLIIVGIVLTGFWRWGPRIKNAFKGKQTITLVNDDTGHANFWHIGSQQEKPILQINSRFMVTNITGHSVALANTVFRGAIKGSVEYSNVLVKDPNSRYWGSYDIPPHARTSVSVCFIISTKQMPKKGATIKMSIGIIDQFGNYHWVKNVTLRAT